MKKINKMIAAILTTTLLIGNTVPAYAFEEAVSDNNISDASISDASNNDADIDDTDIDDTDIDDTDINDVIVENENTATEEAGDTEEHTWKYMGEWTGDYINGAFENNGITYELYVDTDRNPGLTSEGTYNEDSKYIALNKDKFKYRVKVISNTENATLGADNIRDLDNSILHMMNGNDPVWDWGNENAAYMYFEYSYYLSELIIDEKITTIDTNKFAGTSLTSIEAPGVTTISEGCFFGNSDLKTVTLGNVTVAPNNCFGSCPELVSCLADGKELKDTATTIGDAAFACDYKYIVGSIDLRNRNVGPGAFMGCPELTEVAIDGTDVTPFSSNENIKVLTTMADEIMNFNINTLEVVNAPNATRIYMFGGDNIVELNAPKVTEIEKQALSSCHKLKAAMFDELTCVKENTFMGCTSLEMVSIKNATEVEAWAFNGCTSLKTISMNNVEKIGEQAFKNCQINVLDLPNVKKIEMDAFSNCTGLTELSFPNIEYVGENAFTHNALTELVIPTGHAITFRTNAFQDGTLKTVIYNDTEKAFKALITLEKQDEGKDGNIINVFGHVEMKFKNEAEVPVEDKTYVNEEFGISMTFGCPEDVVYNGKQHVQTGTALTEKQSKSKCADLGFEINGVPENMVVKIVYKNNIKAMGGSYYYVQLSLDKNAGLSKSEKIVLKKTIKKVNKELKAKDNRVKFNIQPRDLSGYELVESESFADKATFKDENGNTLAVSYKKTAKSLKVKSVKCTYGNKTFTVSAKQIARKVEKGDEGYTLTLTGAGNYTGTLTIDL